MNFYCLNNSETDTLIYNDKLNLLEMIRIRCRLIRSFVRWCSQITVRKKRATTTTQRSINWTVKSLESLIRSWKTHSFCLARELCSRNVTVTAMCVSVCVRARCFFFIFFTTKWLLHSEPNPLSIKRICIIFFLQLIPFDFVHTTFFFILKTVFLRFH